MLEEFLASTPEGDERRREVEGLLAELNEVYEKNPLQSFRPHPCPVCGLYANAGCGEHRTPQADFMAAVTRGQAALAGNRLGKTCSLTNKAYVQHVPDEGLPGWLRPFKLWPSRRRPGDERPVMGRLVCPSFKVMESVTLPELRKWAPLPYLWKGSFDKAWEKSSRQLRFADGGLLDVFTYEQDADKFVGSSLDYVGYDEPPPKAIFEENAYRLVDRNGFWMMAMTPVNMAGGGIGWIYRDVWKARLSDPDLTVVQGSIHDNPLLDPEAVAAALAMHGEDDPHRRAREFGEFVHIGGMVYEGGFERHLADGPAKGDVKELDVVVGIDPGMRNAAFVWVGFDSDNVALVFDEVLLNDKTPKDYAKAIRAKNAEWGVSKPLYVVDPSFRNRSLVNAESVQSALEREGIFCAAGQNAVEPGCQEVRLRLSQRALLVSRKCRGLRDEAEEYRLEDRPDGEFKVVKENDHRLDALRYACMSRAWHQGAVRGAEAQPKVWVPGEASPHLFDLLGKNHESPPMGAFS